jgi:hypothetical protein
MKFVLADDVRDVFRHALLESKPRITREPQKPPARRSRPLRSSVQP